MKNLLKTMLLFATILISTENSNAFTPKKVVTKGGTKSGGTVTYYTVKQRGHAHGMVLKCLGNGPNACTIRTGIIEDDNGGESTYTPDLSEFDMSQIDMGIQYAQLQIHETNPVTNGSHTWATLNTVSGVLTYFNVAWNPSTTEIGSFEILVQQL